MLGQLAVAEVGPNVLVKSHPPRLQELSADILEWPQLVKEPHHLVSF